MTAGIEPFAGKEVVDLSHVLGPDTPPYPGDPPLQWHSLAELKRDGYCLTAWSGVFHTGTHLDAPSHFSLTGDQAHQLKPSCWAGQAWVIPVPEGQDPDLEHVLTFPPPPDTAFLLFRTGWDVHYPLPEYFKGHPLLTPNLTEWLSDQNLQGIGLDLPSPDQAPYPVHQALLGKGMVILENLRDLSRLPIQRSFTLLCIPLPLKAEASWVRPLALI
jgi:arylformamidase